MMLQRRIESWRCPEAAMFAYVVVVVVVGGVVGNVDDGLHLKPMTSCRQCSSFLRCFDIGANPSCENAAE